MLKRMRFKVNFEERFIAHHQLSLIPRSYFSLRFNSSSRVYSSRLLATKIVKWSCRQSIPNKILYSFYSLASYLWSYPRTGDATNKVELKLLLRIWRLLLGHRKAMHVGDCSGSSLHLTRTCFSYAWKYRYLVCLLMVGQSQATYVHVTRSPAELTARKQGNCACPIFTTAWSSLVIEPAFTLQRKCSTTRFSEVSTRWDTVSLLH